MYACVAAAETFPLTAFQAWLPALHMSPAEQSNYYSVTFLPWASALPRRQDARTPGRQPAFPPAFWFPPSACFPQPSAYGYGYGRTSAGFAMGAATEVPTSRRCHARCC